MKHFDMGTETGVLMKIMYEDGTKVTHAAYTIVPVKDLEDWDNVYVKQAKSVCLHWAVHRGFI